jgi:hypothetical protein
MTILVEILLGFRIESLLIVANDNFLYKKVYSHKTREKNNSNGKIIIIHGSNELFSILLKQSVK